MGKQGCESCSRWEEEIYWTHFKCIHFSVFLHSGFHQRLAIPEKFSRELKKKLPEVVSLRSPSGSTWEVGLTTYDDILFFNHGWQEFMKDHFLEENDFLIFKYNGDSHFDVLVFDGQSMCEKELSYFVKKGGHGCNERGCQTKRTSGESSIEVTIASLDGVVEGSQPKKPSSNDANTTPVGQPIISGLANVETCNKNKLRNPIQTSQSTWKRETSSDDEEIEVKPGIGQVSNEGRKSALQLAYEAASDDGLVIIMKPSHIKKYYVSIPTVWMAEHLSPERQDVFLRMNEKIWRIRILYIKGRKRGAFSSGWRKFSVENKLQVFDVCLFEPSCDKVRNLPVLDVNIFREVHLPQPL